MLSFLEKNLNMDTINEIEDSVVWDLYTSKGSNEAFSQIYHNHYNILYYIGLKYTSDIPVIEDSIQNIFIYILNHKKKLRLIKNIRAYLIKSFLNQLFREIGKQRKLIHSDQLIDNQFEYFNNSESNIIENEENELLKQALKQSLRKLSVRQQEIMYLRFDNELSYDEISEILEISVDSCYKSIYRSIKLIKADIDSMTTNCKNLFLWFINRFQSKFFN